jgi:uncharacterized membrane protein HdeD (DUF308 family)
MTYIGETSTAQAMRDQFAEAKTQSIKAINEAQAAGFWLREVGRSAVIFGGVCLIGAAIIATHQLAILGGVYLAVGGASTAVGQYSKKRAQQKMMAAKAKLVALVPK